MGRWVTVPMVLWIVYGTAQAQSPFAVTELSLDRIYGTRIGDPTLYCVLGANSCLFRGLRSAWTDDSLAEQWLDAHPYAVATPVSSRTWPLWRTQPGVRTVYLWIEDGGASLNVELVREGHYPATFMVDMVDADPAKAQGYGDPRLDSLVTTLRAQAVASEAEALDDGRPHRLVSDQAYAAMMRRIDQAESSAKADRRGIWSDAGFEGRRAPTDAYLLRQYREHPEWFMRVRTLLRQDPRLSLVSQQPTTWDSAERIGIRKGTLDEYLGLLEQLDANHRLVGVTGLGKICLIEADITPGLFDNGIIKGYVLLPSDPHPVVENLERWPTDIGDGEIAYRPIADGWYLFEMRQ